MTYDFIIIGGGIAGASVAARLSHLGTCLLLEAEPAIAYHASGRSAALFEANYGHPVTVELNKASKDYHMTANGGVLSPRGLMFLAAADQADLFVQDVAKMHLDEISVEEACAMVPILDPYHVAMAAHHDAAWDIDTDREIQDFLREMRAMGGEMRTDARVTGLRRDRELWQVTVGEEVIAARTLVNAAGAWADEIARMAGVAPLGLRPLRRSMARLRAPGGHDVSGWPMLIGAGETWYAKPDAGAWLVSPAEEDPVEAPHDAYADDMVLAEGLERYQPFVTEDVTRPIATWAGLRTFSPDRALVLGPAVDMPSFIWVAGQGGYGFQTAPAASQLVADILAGRPSELDPAIVAALSPERFA